MKLKFFMQNGQVIEIDPPVDFNFNMTCLAVRAAGYFLVGNLYIDHFKINAIAFGDQQVDISIPEGTRLQ